MADTTLTPEELDALSAGVDSGEVEDATGNDADAGTDADAADDTDADADDADADADADAVVARTFLPGGSGGREPPENTGGASGGPVGPLPNARRNPLSSPPPYLPLCPHRGYQSEAILAGAPMLTNT